MLCLTNITKKYKEKLALDDVSLELAPGIYGLLGPNGAGKSTLMNIVTGNLKPDGGQVLWDGKEIKSLGAQYRSIIGYAPQQQGLYDAFTGKRFLAYMATLKGISKKEMSEEIARVLSYVNMTEAANRPIGTYSGGMKQRILIAQAILGDPKLIVLDEPTAGLDPKERVRFRNILSVLSKDRIVILSTHIVSDIESIANHVIMIKEKHLLKNDTVPNICKELYGKVFEQLINESEIQEFEQKRIILSMRQESEKMMVRYYSEEEDNNARPCTPNLEDVFLVTYREEK